LKVYAPEFRLDAAVDAITKVGDWEEIEHHGTRRRGQKVTVTMQSPMGTIDLVQWLDESRDPIRAEIPMPGLGNIVMITTTQEKALADFLPPEIFLKSAVKADRALDKDKLRRVTYRLRSTNGNGPVGEFPETAAQSVRTKDDGTTELVVTRVPHQKPSKEAPCRPGS
jgi:hypothetical protein